MNTWHIHIEGQVQGVGFRPFIYSLAKDHLLNGWVNNTTDGVHIEVNANKANVLQFYHAILSNAPALAQITRHHIFEAPRQSFDDFRIIHSKETDTIKLLLTPDFALCPNCRQDLYQTENRRYTYPFTTCTYCGPRYSITKMLPYDRETTSMEAFDMCTHCEKEYNDPLDRRYYAQTNSCNDCSIPIKLFDSEQKLISTSFNQIIASVVQAWKQGKIVAIKGIGGYLLCCDAKNTSAVALLRSRKGRPSKPFALMYPDKTSLSADTSLHEQALEDLNGPASPIVLLDHNKNARLAENIAPGLNQIGAMLPYAPIFELLLKEYQQPIVATSGNPTGSPIVFEDDKALKELNPLADLIMTNDRTIIIPQDDSLVRYAPFSKNRVILRRSRGMAPTYLNARLKCPSYCVLATGAMLKSTFTFLHQQNIYISQYLGDLSDFETEESFKHTLQHFFQLFDNHPQYILADLHPAYPSTRQAKELAVKLDAKLELVQHHEAHFAAVLGENNLLHATHPVLGVIWDGTGLGYDKQIWGGEFFTYQNYTFKRITHFEYFDFILGDKMPREPRISALACCRQIPGAEKVLEQKFSKTEWAVYRQLLKKGSALKTSSLGRIYDAVSSLLGLSDKQTYEGEAAMKLEVLALSYFQKHGLDFSASYFENLISAKGIPTQSLMTGIVTDLIHNKNKAYIAAKFHFSLIHLIKIIANQENIYKLAFSGGVFQNTLLIDLIHYHLDKPFELFFHHQLSPNDESVSFGQLICHQIKVKNGQLNEQKSFILPDSSIS